MDKQLRELSVEKFVEMIRTVVKDVLKEELAKTRTETCYNGIITAISGELASVDIGNTILDDIPNRTGLVLGEALNIKDAVRVYSVSPTLTDAYIGIKLN